MWSKLEEVFSELESENGMPYSRQGSYEPDEELPSDFFTFFNVNTEFDDFFDDFPTICNWEWQIMFYTNNPANLYNGLELFIEKAKEKGFLFEGKGKDIFCDEPSYVGRTVKTTYVERLTN